MMVEIALYLLLSIPPTGPVQTVERFPTLAECQRLEQRIKQAIRGYTSTLLCERATILVQRPS